MHSSASRTSSSWSSSPSRISRRRRPTKTRSAGDHSRSVLSTAIINGVLLFVAVVAAAAASAHAAGAAQETDPTLDESLFTSGAGHHPPGNETMITDVRRRRSGGRRALSRADAECNRNLLWGRRVHVADYEYGCKQIERMLAGDITLIGNGQVRDVYLAEYRGREVAVKILRHVDSLKGQKKLLSMHRQEVVTLDALKGHPNVVNMLGLCGTTVVTEYFKDNFLSNIHRHGKELSLRRVVSLALDVARGMQAVHEVVGGVHMDMKPQQLLVDNNGHGKVNDFNSIHFMGFDAQGEFCPTHAAKPVRMIPWRSPENVAGEFVTDKSDIYSLGMIFYSLINGGLPYENSESFRLALINKTRPDIDPSWHKDFAKVIKAMWREHAEDRPPARKVVAKLEAILDGLP